MKNYNILNNKYLDSQIVQIMKQLSNKKYKENPLKSIVN